MDENTTTAVPSIYTMNPVLRRYLVRAIVDEWLDEDLSFTIDALRAILDCPDGVVMLQPDETDESVVTGIEYYGLMHLAVPDPVDPRDQAPIL